MGSTCTARAYVTCENVTCQLKLSRARDGGGESGDMGDKGGDLGDEVTSSRGGSYRQKHTW